jgi:hypothetical protein
MIEENEVEIVGSWEMKDGRMVEDAACQRIRELVATELQQVAVSEDGWEKLYRDQRDGRLWEWFYPQSELHGGGPPALRVVSPETAEQKYHFAHA